MDGNAEQLTLDMRTPLSLTFTFPKATQPCFLAALVCIAVPGKPIFIRPRHGEHVSIPIGLSWGSPKPLGPLCLAPRASPEAAVKADLSGPFSVNFAVLSRHASALPIVSALLHEMLCWCPVLLL